jgi:hypothetical protein
MGGMTGAAIGKFGNQTPAQGVAQYTPAQTRSTYNPAFSSQQTAQPVIQGLPQQMAPQGLQGLMSQMMSRYQSPYQMQQRAPMPMNMPQYRNAALSYRPDMANAQQALTRVKPSVYKTDLDTARLREELDVAQQPAFDYNAYYVGG